MREKKRKKEIERMEKRKVEKEGTILNYLVQRVESSTSRPSSTDRGNTE